METPLRVLINAHLVLELLTVLFNIFTVLLGCYVLPTMDEKVQQFISITGSSVDAARSLLEACGGNVDLAINMHLESGGGGRRSPSGQGLGPSSDATGGASEKSYEEIHGVRAPIPQTRGVLIEETAPPTRVMRSRRLPKTVFDPFQDYSAAAKVPGPGERTKKQTLADIFKPPYDIMFQGTFHEARLAGQAKGKWLLVNVQDSKEFGSQILNRDVWSNHNVKDLIKQNFVFWQIHRITDDGVRFRQLYHLDAYPYVAIIDPRTGEKMVNWNHVTVAEFLPTVFRRLQYGKSGASDGKLEGKPGNEDSLTHRPTNSVEGLVVTRVKEFLSNNHFDDEMDGPEDSSNVVNQSEESQLEAAIRASLEQLNNGGNKTLSDTDEDLFSIESEESEMETENGDYNTTCKSKSTDDTNGLLQGKNSDIFGSNLTRREDGRPCDPISKTTSNTRLNPDIKLKPFSVDINPISPRRVGRKRPSSSEAETELPRKALRRDSDSQAPPKPKPKSLEASKVTDSSKQTKGRVGRKGKGKAKDTVKAASIEEDLASGALKKEEVSQLLIRLPSGDRVQKAFLCHQPIQELFDYLILEDFDLTDHEVVTQFPRRCVSALHSSTSFKDAGLYPRETIFIHPTD